MEKSPLYSAEITEIIGTPPRWIMRVGGGLLLGLVLGFGALAASISIPEQNVLAVRLRNATPPYYLRPGLANGQPAVPAGQVVRRGQPLLHYPLNPAADERAPFTGTLLYEDLAAGSRRAGDTLGLLVPLATAYRFSGRLAVGRLPELRAAGELRLEVPLAGRTTSLLALRGHLTYLDPAVHEGTVTYNGQLDSLSGVALARHFTGLTALDGTLLLPQPARPILQRLLGY
ncbi:MAG TPA: hypothetical protein VF629_12400 [Hymenobacter sp.]|jgi:hypothetical protein|uniref:hypothetical protein n=1 Tax=Hymenobacter sp. TaxID=1898978 RepID=UPI002EDAA8C2